ncbi:MAG: T9SS type A sorting domain-containing protein [Candidatus Cloacimonetes bacterium]|nr:T9SS type A sorting domain-containing protein [Candidatus Cloacimonadota bacterium]
MKIVNSVILLLIVITGLYSMQIDNIQPQLIMESGLIRLENPDGFTIYNYAEVSPAIPLLSYNFEIPNGMKLAEVTLTPINTKEIVAEKPVMQAPEAVNYTDTRIALPRVYTHDSPRDYLIRFSTNRSGAYHFGTITYYAAVYKADTNTIIIPESFNLEWSLTPEAMSRNPYNHSSAIIAEGLNLPTQRTTTPEKLLYISTNPILNASEELLEFRSAQGFDVYTGSIENILATYDGIDNAQKLKNYITDQYLTYGIDYVTLAGDFDIVPYRWVWAFDCEFGMSVVENNIPSDMYFSCLDNDWDADGDGIFGEDEDNPDYYAELFVSRLSFHTAGDVSSYTTRLIDYEKGHLYPDTGYNRSLGLSMNLWSTSNSVVTQEYILDHYFPPYYSNTILNDQENTVANFLTEIYQEPNIIQHTGHAFHSVMSLGQGSINTQVAESLNMQATTGLMYSIGCWSAAFDFPSIAETMQFHAPVLGFLGNSRYGWGAPGADGFGFSEYFQKEFFKQYFRKPDLTLSALNYMQKLPFLPYLYGDSVYKWVAYEMNALGDAGYRPMRNNPEPLQAESCVITNDMGAYLSINASSNGAQISEAVVRTAEGATVFTNETGFAMLDYIPVEPVSVYKYGYEMVDSCGVSPEADITITYAEIVPLDSSQICLQNSNYRIDFTLHSQADSPISYWVEMVPDEPDFFALTEQFISGIILPNESVEIDGYGFHINPTPSVPQLNNGRVLGMQLNVYEIGGNTNPLASINVDIPIIAPILNLLSTEQPALPLSFNSPNSMTVTLGCESGSIEGPIELTLSNPNLVQNATATLDGNLSTGDEFVQTLSFELNESTNLTEEFDLHIQYNFNNQVMMKEFVYLLPTVHTGQSSDYWQMDFNNGSAITIPMPWQIVDAYDESCLSCRPTGLGDFDFQLPQTYWIPGMELNFRYTYRMPMYGSDGIAIHLSGNGWDEEVLFLGSGGALLRENGFIYSDWANYNLPLGEIITRDMAFMEPFNITFRFTAAEGDIMPDYTAWYTIGVFLDDISLRVMPSLVNTEEIIEVNGLISSVYPNPVRNNLNIKVKSNEREQLILECFNIKGQKIFKKILDKEKGVTEFSLDISKQDGFKSSGIYFYRIKNHRESVQGKFIVIR